MTEEASSPESFGPYALVSLLGEGGMARVYRAVREGPMGFRKEVAIKRIRPDLTRDDQTLVRHLINEARLGGQLHHPNVVDVYEFGQVGDEHYIAMEFVNGLTLEALFAAARRRDLRLPRSMVLDLMRQVCDGLAYAHELASPEGEPLHLVHRDLKPANVIVSAAGQAKIMDFGIARTAAALYKTTNADAAKGTLQYMAPEQLEEPDALDHRADIFAIGSILFEALVGEPLLKNTTAQSLMWMVVAGTFRPRLGMLDEVFPAIRPVISRCVEVDREERYPDAGELARDLRRLHEEVARGPGCKELMALVAARAEGDADQLARLGDEVLESDRRSGGDTGWSDFLISLGEQDTTEGDPFACGFHASVSSASLPAPGSGLPESREVTVVWQADEGPLATSPTVVDRPSPAPRRAWPLGLVAAAAVSLALVLLFGPWQPWSRGERSAAPPPHEVNPEGATDRADEGAIVDPHPDGTPTAENRTTGDQIGEQAGSEATFDGTPVDGGEDRVAVHRHDPPRDREEDARAGDPDPPDPPPIEGRPVVVKINSDPWSMVTMSGDRQAPPHQSPYTLELPAGTYHFGLRVPESGQSATLTVTLDGSEGELSRCHSFITDGPC